MRIQSRNGYDDGLDGLDPYFTCPEATASLIALEGDRLPHCLWEPAAGDGAIVRPLRARGRIVHTSDVHNYGLAGCGIYDYLTAAPPPGIEGIATNPPYRLAQPFAAKALSEGPYVALLVRSNFDIAAPADSGMAISETSADDAPLRLEWATSTEQHAALLVGLGTRRTAAISAGLRLAKPAWSSRRAASDAPSRIAVRQSVSPTRRPEGLWPRPACHCSTQTARSSAMPGTRCYERIIRFEGHEARTLGGRHPQGDVA